MDTQFDNILKHVGGRSKKELLFLCSNLGETKTKLRDYLSRKDVPYKLSNSTFTLGNIKVMLQYVRDNDKWTDNLRGIVFDRCYLDEGVNVSPYAKKFLGSRVNPEAWFVNSKIKGINRLEEACPENYAKGSYNIL